MQPRSIQSILPLAAATALFLGAATLNLTLIRSSDVTPAIHLPSVWLVVARAALNSLVFAAIVYASSHLGWHATRLFWITGALAAVSSWLVSVVAPAMLVPVHSNWGPVLVWAGPVAVVALLLLWIAGDRQRASEIFHPIAFIIERGGMVTLLVAVAIPLRIGLFAYNLPIPFSTTSSLADRLQHVPAPSGYTAQSNPFQDPRFSVVLEHAGENIEAVQRIIEQAVEHRTPQRAAALVRDVPQIVKEAADQKAAQELSDRLREAGARSEVLDTINWFVETIRQDRRTPIGKPSQVLDEQFLRTGRDSIAELRAALTREGEAVDRSLATQAYVAFVTAEGRSLYQTHCRSCHGTKASGDGAEAAGFTLRPVNLRDPASIGSLSASEVLWRIEEGGTGLPVEAAPWDSSMPAWRHDLDRELAWKITLGEFSTANAHPRATADNAHRHHQPAATTPHLLPDKSWLEWPVRAKPTAEQSSDPQFVKRGAYLYYFRCMPCHGVTGAGDGPAAYTMWPRPRDFTDLPVPGFEEQKAPPKFKFRTTKQGWLPTDEDLYRTISRGLSGTAMEGWDGVLEPQEIWQVIAYLKTLSPSWNDPEHIARNPNDPVVVKQFTEFDGSSPLLDYDAMQPPPVTSALLAEGRDVFLKFRCFECHGFEARGDGPALGQHYDDWGFRMWPQNLANPYNYKAGHAIKDIFRTFAHSLDGTVMPVLAAKTIDSKDLARGEHLQWALAAYVNSLVPDVSKTHATVPFVVAGKLPGDLPRNPDDVRWQRIPATVVPLSGQVIVAPRWSSPSVRRVQVRVATKGEETAIWFRWDDRRPNVSHQEVSADFAPPDGETFGPVTYAAPAMQKKAPVVFDARDQLEFQFPAKLAPSRAGVPIVERPPILYGSADSPVIVHRWRADQQGLEVTKRVEEIAGAKAERVECVSRPDSDTSRAVERLQFSGPADPGPPESEPTVQSMAGWSNGAWTVVVSGRRLLPAEYLDAARPVPMAVRIWDGLAGEADLRMAISSWLDVVSVPPRPVWHHGMAIAIALVAAGALFWFARRHRARLTAS